MSGNWDSGNDEENTPRRTDGWTVEHGMDGWKMVGCNNSTAILPAGWNSLRVDYFCLSRLSLSRSGDWADLVKTMPRRLITTWTCDSTRWQVDGRCLAHVTMVSCCHSANRHKVLNKLSLFHASLCNDCHRYLVYSSHPRTVSSPHHFISPFFFSVSQPHILQKGQPKLSSQSIRS